MRFYPINLFIFTVILLFSSSLFASVEKELALLETSFDGRIGIDALNTGNQHHIQHRAEGRIPIQSTFKVMVVSAILKQSMKNKNMLQEKIKYSKNDLVFWSPITEKHVASGMTIAELCKAAMEYSDNTATNLLMKKLGGSDKVTAFARSIGDNTFRIDGWEPELNSEPSKPEDTSTPEAMAKSLQQLTFGEVLGTSERAQLVQGLKGNTTGDTRIRAGVPKGWIVGDKTGTGEYGMSHDIGIIWPPHCAPIIVTIYTIQNKKNAERRDDILVKATKILINAFAERDTCIKL